MVKHGRLALDRAATSQNQVVRAMGRFARACGLISTGRFDEALEQLGPAMEIAVDRAMMKPHAATTGFALLVETHLRRGDLDAARTAAERGLELAHSLHYRHSEASYWIWLALVRIAAGGLASAEDALASAHCAPPRVCTVRTATRGGLRRSKRGSGRVRSTILSARRHRCRQPSGAR